MFVLLLLIFIIISIIIPVLSRNTKDSVFLFTFSSEKIESTEIIVNQTVADIGADIFWGKGFKGENIRIGIIDTGIDSTHKDLKIKKRRDYVNDNASPKEYNVHGTHVAGIIAANGILKGVAPHAELFDYRVLDKNGSGNYNSIIKAVYDAVKDGCDIINMSLGGPYPHNALKKALKYASKKKCVNSLCCRQQRKKQHFISCIL